MSSSTGAIKVENLSKRYQLGVIGHGSLKQDLQSWWAKLRGREDPNAQIELSSKADQSGSKFLALQDVNFEIKRGEVVGIVGKNGAGKSTLLKILSRITTPTEGNIFLNGTVASLLEVGTGFHPELTGRENIFLNGAILGMTRADVSRKMDEIVSFAGVEKFVDTPVKRYSSGMYVRLAFAVAAHLEPEILIVDEVLAVGDLQFQRKCIGKMQEVSEEGRTILFVSHNMEAVERLCKRAIVLDSGQVRFDGGITDGLRYYNDRLVEDTWKQVVDSHRVEFPDDAKRPFQIRALQIGTDEGRLEYSLAEPIPVRLEFVVRDRLPNMIFFITCKRGAELVFLNCDASESNDLPRDYAPGEYTASFEIPKHYLPVGDYLIQCSAGAAGDLATRFSPEEGIAIRIHHNENPDVRFSYQAGASGQVLFEGHWEVQLASAPKC